MTCDLSICIVNWNCRDHLRRCLQSIRAASAGVVVETIVVDNASTDGAADMVAREFPEVVLVRNDSNRGFATANNQAAAVSRGAYLLFLNNDTIVGQESLAKIVAFMKAHPRVGLAGPRLIGLDGKTQQSCRRKPTYGACLHRLLLLRWTMLFSRAYRRFRRDKFDPNRPAAVETLMGAAVVMPREVFAQHGGWDEGFVFGIEDVDLSVRVAKTHEVVFMADADIVHLGRSSSRANSGPVYIGYESGYARYLRKHAGGSLGTIAYKALFCLNLPIAILVELARHGWRMLTGRREKPGRRASQLRPMIHFLLHGLGRFLRA